MSRRRPHMAGAVTTPKRTDGIPMPTGRPVFFHERPPLAYGSPHAAPRVNTATLERHPLECACEKCSPGSWCACYACAWERRLREAALSQPGTVSTTRQHGNMNSVSSVTWVLDSVRPSP